MAEYIEREALIEDLDAAAKHGGMGAIISQTLQRYVKRAPAADVAPVVHGRWIATHDEFCSCSLCKYPVYVAWGQTNYCHNCGAMMDGGADNATD